MTGCLTQLTSSTNLVPRPTLYIYKVYRQGRTISTRTISIKHRLKEVKSSSGRIKKLTLLFSLRPEVNQISL